jgi:hypothetical protein
MMASMLLSPSVSFGRFGAGLEAMAVVSGLQNMASVGKAIA